MIVNGVAVNTRWGPVRVQAKISANRIIDVVVLMQPTGELLQAALDAAHVGR